MSLALLLTDLADLQPVVPGDAVADAHRRLPPEPALPPTEQLLTAGDIDDMTLQRWGIIAPEGADGDAMLSAVAPLRAWREQQMDAPAIVLRVPPDMSRDAQRTWKHRHWQRLPWARRPRYLLILGDLHQVPLTIQQSLTADACVGRLCFTRLDGAVDRRGFVSYSQKVIDSERAAGAHEHPRLLFYADRDLADDALENHYAYVIKQCYRQARDNGDAPAGSIQRFARPGAPQWGLEHGPADSQWTAAPGTVAHWAQQAHPSVLVSLCHGAGVADPAVQRERQGALVLAGAQGKQVIDHSHFHAGDFLPDGFWLLNACFGAGTPAHSVYHPWLEKLAALGGERVTPAAALTFLAGGDGRPFIARVPQAALANPRGPLGFLGHVDIVWGYGYRDALGGATADSSPYYGIVQALARGQRFGVAMRCLADQAAALGLELAFLEDDDADPARQLLRTRVWLQCWDLFGYILLGDPAARLPVRGAHGAHRDINQPPTREPTPGRHPGPPAEPGPGEARGRSVKAMQEAVFRCIRGDQLALVAARASVSVAELERWLAAYTAAGRAALSALDTDARTPTGLIDP